ncbi:hypothetical protein DCS_03372 [Drechmeria coniospora]|uniref:Uncharacterized protein n=1 Tax=Drechmeria coniospora TaxID=98403 RepID=A0A151GH30_DRECN|nr:hypothetical protein DCS_03372 [Drechmeria coniospora]KYK56372.1 hypothetical protein DCS_03372 [Drechmeria coniospora]
MDMDTATPKTPVRAPSKERQGPMVRFLRRLSPAEVRHLAGRATCVPLLRWGKTAPTRFPGRNGTRKQGGAGRR